MGNKVNSIRRQLFLQSLPMLLGILFFGGLWLLGWSRSGKMVETYVAEIESSNNNQQYLKSRIALERILSTNPANRTWQFLLAQTELKLGNESRASILLDALAPDDEKGMPEAHFEKAKLLLARTAVTTDLLNKAEKHLQFALNNGAGNWEAHFLLSQIYIAKKQYPPAQKELELIVKDKPETNIWLGRLLKQMGHESEAQEKVAIAEKFCREQIKSQQSGLQCHNILADALLFQKKYSEAVDVLKAAYNQYQKHPQLSRALAGSFVTWADATESKSGSRNQVVLSLLLEAMRYAPNQSAITSRIVRSLQIKGPDAAQYRQTLRKAAVNGRPNGALFLILGNDAAERGDTQEAKALWEQALLAEPHLVHAANNLADYWNNAKPGDPKRALALINGALEHVPLNPPLHFTRGQILLNMKDYKGALRDLQFALSDMSASASLHEAIAEAYQGVGAPDMAAQHQQRAVEIRSPAGHKTK